MRRALPFRDRLARPWLAAGLAACALLGPSVSARGQAPGPESFAREPKTPLELWDAIDYLVRVGHPDQAVPYLKTFVASKPSDDVLLEIRDRYGAGSILRLGDSPATRDQARPLLEMLNAASRRHATNPQRIKRSIAGLSKSREEQQYSIEQLRRAGPYAVPHLVESLGRNAISPEERALITGHLGELDPTAVPAVVSMLDSPEPRIAADAASALGRIGDPRAIPYLTYFAALNDELSPIRTAARRAITQLTGRTFEQQPKTAVRVLTDEARKYHLHAVQFPADQVEVWTWDGAPTPHRVSRSDAEAILGLRFARQALALDPSDIPAQVAFLSLALEKAVERAGVDAFPGNDPSGVYSSALAAGPAVLGKVLRTALADGHSDLAAAAAAALGRVTDRDGLGADGRPNPLVEALTAPDRRVQLAAARALVELEPQKPFPGSSRVVPVLARFVTGQSSPKVVVIDGAPNRGSQLVAHLKSLGYDPLQATTGDQGFRLAANSADVEAVFLDPTLLDGSWRMIDTLSNLRADARTAGIPVFLVAPLGQHDRIKAQAASFPRVEMLVTPTSAEVLKPELDRALGRMGVRPLSAAQRDQSAQLASALLARVASRPGSPFESTLTVAEPALTSALRGPATGPAASAALADVPGVDAQRGLADTLLDPSVPAQLRLGSAGQLARSLQRFGPLLAADQERQLVEALDQASDPALRTALAEVIGALRPKSAAVGRRLQAYNPAGTEATPPAPAPDANAPAEPAAEAPPPPQQEETPKEGANP
jgi:DNA-binding response OmpR family regulator